MGAVLAILFIIGLWEAVKYAGEHSRADYRKSRDKKVKEAPPDRRRATARNHAAGYWAGEALHGFPVWRTGLHAGWLEHRKAAAQEKAVREKARAEHAETHVSVAGQIRQYRKRQEEAKKRAEQQEEVPAQATSPPLPPDTAQQPAAEPDPAPDERTADDIEAWEQASNAPAIAGWLRATQPDPRLNDAQRQRDADGKRNICAACGHPGTPDDRLVVAGDGYRVHGSHTTDPADGYYGQRAAPLAAVNGNGSKPPATEGGHMPTGTAADTTYDQAMAEAQKVIDAQEEKIAILRASRMGNVVEGMAGLVNDSGSLSRAAEIDEALRQELKAAEQTLDAAQAFRDGLRHDHGGMNAAHQDAPVRGAQPEFYEG